MLRTGRVLLPKIIGLISWSCRCELSGFDNLLSALRSGRPVVMITWHGNIVPVLIVRMQLRFPMLLALASRSRDGEITTALSGPFGVACTRGSSSKGGAQGLLQLNKALADEAAGRGALVGIIFPDGPRGPRHKAKPGVLQLARTADVLLVPVITGCSRRYMFRRAWDRHRLPLPFSRVVCRFGEPIDLRANVSDSPRESGEPPLDEAGLGEILAELARGEPLCLADYEAACATTGS